MQQAKFKGGLAVAKLGNGDEFLSCVQYEGTFTLTYSTFFACGAHHSTLHEDAKRLSTINKKAEKYGVEFVL